MTIVGLRREIACLLRSFAVGLLLASAACRSQPPAVVLATTTSVVNSGLVDRLLPVYERQSGSRVQVLPVGSGRALRMLELGQADVVVSHAPHRESEALSANKDWSYRKILYNDFLIAGPPNDPASLAGATDALDAMRRIAASKSRWVSRGDESGTHEREQELWQSSGASPPAGRLVTSGQGMGATLRVASEMDAYTLADRGTFEQLAASIRLKDLYSGDVRLLNTYAVLTPRTNLAGSAFADWLAEGKGRKELERLIDAGTLHGFHLWPADRPGTRPDALPQGRAALPSEGRMSWTICTSRAIPQSTARGVDSSGC